MAAIPHRLRLAILRRDGFLCRVCLAGDDLAIDHIWPRCEGGPTVEWNLRVLCRPCNLAKRNTNGELGRGGDPWRFRARAPFVHGTRAAYCRDRCRCVECRRWSSTTRAARKARQRAREAAMV